MARLTRRTKDGRCFLAPGMASDQPVSVVTMLRALMTLASGPFPGVEAQKTVLEFLRAAGCSAAAVAVFVPMAPGHLASFVGLNDAQDFLRCAIGNPVPV